MSDITITDTLALEGPTFTRREHAVDIHISGGLITAIEPAGKLEPTGEIINGAHLLAAPGLINGHHHSHEDFHKGRYDRLPLELWMNYVRPVRPLPLSADDVYLRTLVGAIQALRSGTTCIVDDFNVAPVLIRDHVDAALQAYEDIGIRALLGPTLFDRPFHRSVPFIEEECPAELLRSFAPSESTPPAEYLDLIRTLARERHPDKHRVGVIAAPSAPQRCTPEFLMQVRRIADEHELPVITHVQETRLQAASAWNTHGKTLFRYLADLGFLGPATSLIHAVWLTPEDIRLIADSGASVQHNPNSNLKLGSGLMPLRALLDAGVNVSLGTDGCGSIESTDMLRVVSNTALLHKLRGDDYRRWPGAEEAFTAGTLGGARALGMEDRIGAIAPGFRADLVLYRRDSIALTPMNDPLRQLVYSETGQGIAGVIVDGKLAVKEGCIVGIDERTIINRIHAATDRLRPHMNASDRHTELLREPYRRIWERCLDLPLPPGTYPARLP